MNDLANLIVTLTKLLTTILGLVKDKYRRDQITYLFLPIIEYVSEELVDQMGDKQVSNVYINPHKLTKAEIELATTRDGNGYISKIPAIKLIKQRTGLGLKEAKDIVDQFFLDNNINQY